MATGTTIAHRGLIAKSGFRPAMIDSMSLSVHRIADAAVAILTDYGMGDLSMRRLARDLGVGPSALYWHVKNKQEIFVLVARPIAAEVDEAIGYGEGMTGADILLRMHDVLLRYRDGADIFSLAYAHSGGPVLPAAVRAQISDEAERHCSVVLTCAAVAFEQNRALFDSTAGPADSRAALASTLSRIGRIAD